MKKIYILIPIYNDWESVSKLIKEINFCIKDLEAEFSILVINDGSNNQQNINLEKLIRQYNTKYKIINITKPENFELRLSILRNYYHKNIIAFGELLHKIHPLAGQGFNMSIRDIKEIIKLIEFKIDHGLDLDNSICKDFENKTRHRNYIFSNGIDFIYEYFNYENKINNNILSKTVKYILMM